MGESFAKRFWLCLAGLLPSAGVFLGLDFLRRLGDHLAGLGVLDLACNVVVVASTTLLVCVIGAAVLALLAGWMGSVGATLLGFVFFFCFYTVNALFLRYRFFEGGYNPIREMWLGLGFLLAVPWLYAVLRSRLRRGQEELKEYARPLCLAILGFTAVSWLLVGFRLLTPGPPAQPGSDKPGIVIVSFDGLAARDMSLYGYSRQTTPGLDGLALDSVVFERCHSVSNSTLLCLPAIAGHHATASTALPTLPRVLSEYGYRSRFISFWSSSFLGLHGFEQSIVVRSFDGSPFYRTLRKVLPRDCLRWLSALGTEELSYFNPFAFHPNDDRYWEREHFPAGLSLDEAVEVLKHEPRGQFLWVHLWAPHYPYLPPPPFAGTFGGPPLPSRELINRAYEDAQKPLVEGLRRRYDEYVLAVDDEVSSFVERLREADVLDQIVLVVTSDHGESFERGVVGHLGPSTHEAVVHVPLLIRFPPASKQSRLAPTRVQTFCDHLDVAPTLLDFVGVPVPDSMPGESMLAYVEEPQRLSSRPRFSLSSTAVRDGRGQVSVFLGRFKLTYIVEEPAIARFYDLFADPGEKTDRSGEHPELLERLRGLLRLNPDGAGP